MDIIRKYGKDLLWLGLLAALYFTGGLRWVQGKVAMLIAGAPKAVEQPVAVNMDWSLRTLEGDFVNLAELGDKPVFLSQWATWCGPCVAEMPSIRSLYKDYGDQVAFVLISQENPDKIEAFTNKHNYTMPVYRPLAQAPEPLFSRSIPATFILDQQGNIVVKHIGAANWNSAKVREVLDGMLRDAS